MFAPQALASYAHPQTGEVQVYAPSERYGVVVTAVIGAIVAIVGAVMAVIRGIADIAIGSTGETTIVAAIKVYQDNWDERVRLVNAIAAKANTYRTWLRMGHNKAQWQTGPTARNQKPAKTSLCNPIYEGGAKKTRLGKLSCGKNGNTCSGTHWAPSGWWGIPSDNVTSGNNPGGYRLGNMGCVCPTHACAFKDPIKAQSYKNWLKKGMGEGWGAGRMNTGTVPHLTGRGHAWELGWLREAWSYMMVMFPTQPLYNITHPTETINIVITKLLDPDVINLLFPGSNGIPPLAMRDYWWSQYANMYRTGIATGDAHLMQAAGQDTQIPAWVFGYSEAEAAALFPDALDRLLTFSLGTLVPLMDEKRRRLLASAGVTGYAGESYGDIGGGNTLLGAIDDATGVGSSSSEMGEWLEEMSQEPGLLESLQDQPPVDSGRQPPVVSRAKFHRVGQLLGDNIRNEPTDTQDTFAVKANYSPLVVGGGVFVAATALALLKK